MTGKKKLYISSTYSNLAVLRREIIDFCMKEGSEDFELSKIMERMFDDGSSKPLVNECIDEVKKCDIYILIVGHRVGSYPADDPSKTFTEREYEAAMDPTSKKKKIFRLVEKFDPAQCDDVNRYNAFVTSLKKYDIHEYSNFDQFQNRYLKILFSIVPRLSYLRNTEELKSKINRKSQTSQLINITEDSMESVQLYGYFSHSSDYAHLWHYRIINCELNGVNIKLNEELYAPLDELNWCTNPGQLINAFVRGIAVKLYGELEGKPLRSLVDFYNHFAASDYNYLIIPIKLDSIESEESRLKQLSEIFNSFSSPDHLKLIGNKKVVFLINLQLSSRTLEAVKLNERIKTLSDCYSITQLQNLELIDDGIILNWITENLKSNPTEANEVLATHFPSGENTMSERARQADSYFKTLEQ